MFWVALREQESVLTCSVFYFSATMATAPYNYSYIFKYIIIGKYRWAPTCVYCVDSWETWGCAKLLSVCACPTSVPTGHHTCLQL